MGYKDIFVRKSKEIHGDKYDYSLVKYANSKTKVKIICPIHGVFEQSPNKHLIGQGCAYCSGKRMNTVIFIKKSKEVHNDKYDYSLVNYVNNKTKVKIICPIHGVFEQSPSNHMNMIQGCPKCSKNVYTNDEFIEKSKEVHGDKYDYSLVDYKSSRYKVKIICTEHGIFEQYPYAHMNKKQGCPKCYLYNMYDNNITFVIKSKKVHGDKYDYSLVDYKDSKTKVKVICPIHGVFEQIPNDHINGSGCNICKESKGEKEIRTILDNMNISYMNQYKFVGCVNELPLIFDFYLPEYNTCIEYDGEQHYKPIEFFGGIDNFNKQVKRDNIKNDYCKDNDIFLLRIKYDDNVEDKIYEILK